MNTLFLCLLVWFCELPVPQATVRDTVKSYQVSPDTRAQRLKDAVAAYDYAQAVSLIDSTLADTLSLTEGAARELKLQKARCQRKLWRYQEACETLESIAYVEDLEVMGELADSYVAAGQMEKALDTYTLLSSLQPENIYFSIQRASLLFKTESYMDCAELGKSICERDPNASVYSLIGGSYSNLNQPDSALVYYRKALEMNPLKAATVTSISNILLQKKDYPGVISQIGSFLQERPDEASVQPPLGLAYYLNDDTEDAFHVFKNLFNAGDRSFGTAYYYGLTALALKEYKEAVSAFESAWQKDSTDIRLAVNFGDALSSYPLSKHSADGMYDHAIKLSLPDSTMMYRAYRGKGYGLMMEEQFSSALSCFLKAHSYHPDDVYPLYLTGYCYRRMKDYKNARIWYQRYLDKAKPGTNLYKNVQEEMEFVDSELFMMETE